MSRSTLQDLSLAQTKTEDEGIRSIGSALGRTNCPLTSLTLSCNAISPYGVRALADGLRVNKRLLSLQLGYCFSGCCSIGKRNPNALQALICDVLPKQRYLKSLRLSCNGLTNVHAKWIAVMLADNICLEDMQLNNNSIGDEGACSLAEGLCKNASLKVLNLLRNRNIGQIGTSAFIAAIRDANYTLEQLQLWHSDENVIPPEPIRKLNDLLRGNRHLKATFEQLESNQQLIRRGLWPYALERISQNKLDFTYSILKSANPLIFQDPVNNLRRNHGEAFGDDTTDS